MTAPSVLLGRFVPQPAESFVLPSTSILRPSPQAAQAVIRAPGATATTPCSAPDLTSLDPIPYRRYPDIRRARRLLAPRECELRPPRALRRFQRRLPLQLRTHCLLRATRQHFPNLHLRCLTNPAGRRIVHPNGAWTSRGRTPVDAAPGFSSEFGCRARSQFLRPSLSFSSTSLRLSFLRQLALEKPSLPISWQLPASSFPASPSCRHFS